MLGENHPVWASFPWEVRSECSSRTWPMKIWTCDSSSESQLTPGTRQDHLQNIFSGLYSAYPIRFSGHQVELFSSSARVKSKTCEGAFTFCSPALLNKVPIELSSMTTVSTFPSFFMHMYAYAYACVLCFSPLIVQALSPHFIPLFDMHAAVKWQAQ